MTDKTSKGKSDKAPSYRVLIGANFIGAQGGKERRIEPGQVVDDLPERVIKPLLKQGAIEEVK